MRNQDVYAKLKGFRICKNCLERIRADVPTMHCIRRRLNEEINIVLTPILEKGYLHDAKLLVSLINEINTVRV